MTMRLPRLVSSMRGATAHGDEAAAGRVGLADSLGAADQRAGREVGAGHLLEQLVERALGLGRDQHQRVDQLAQVVRRDVRRHADGDAGGAVREQVRQPRRQHRRLAGRAVEVRHEVDRLAVDVAQQLFGDRARDGIRCSDRRRADRRRSSRSCPGRRSADSGARSPGPCARARRRPRSRRAGGSASAPRRRRRRTSSRRASGAGLPAASRRGCGGGRASGRRARRAARG